MAISKIKGGAINDDAISTAKIQDDAVTDPKIVDSYTTSVKTNPEFQGTEAARMPVGTTAERANAQSGDIRFNSTLSLMEYYDGTEWKAIDSPPAVSSVSPSTFSASGTTITVTGSNYQTGVNVTLQDNTGSTYTPDSVTRVSSSELTFDITSAIVADVDDPWDIIVSNPSGLSVTSANSLTLQGSISLNTSAGSLGTVYDSGRSSLSYDLGVTDSISESDVTFTYSISAGSLPAGLSLNTSTGAVTGTATTVGSDTTSNFTITYLGADSSDSSYAPTADTAYSLTIAAPVITSYTSTGSGSFSVPSGVTAVDVLVVAGGGSGGCDTAGGGGAGGLIYRPAFPVTPGGSVSYSVGAGGDYGPVIPNAQAGNDGQNSTFGSLTAQGGGGGGSGGAGVNNGRNGGSAGGGRRNQGDGGTGTQPQQPGDSGTYGFGNPGTGGASQIPSYDNQTSGGGGGAGAAAPNTPSRPGIGAGGAGKQYDISGSQVYYAGGGGGGTENLPDAYQAVGGQGGGGTGGYRSVPTRAATDGTANRGGGGGGAGQNPEGGSGGSGIVIVKY